MRRRWFFVISGALFLIGLWVLDIRVSELVPNEGGRKLAGQFFSAALQPAFDFEDPDSRARDLSFAGKIGTALWLTLRYAIVAMSLALVLGLIGGIVSSRSWWGRHCPICQTLRIGVRLLATAVRSVHELMWALLFLAAVGTSPIAAILAIALPYGGTLAKVFSEILDEADDSAASVMRSAGASGLTAFLGGTFFRALPDMITYALYRLECAIRSSAVLGFVGVPTIGYEISTAFEDGHYREIWTYLYSLLILVILFEAWGARVRKILNKGVPGKQSSASDSQADLWKARGRSSFLRFTAIFLGTVTLLGWFTENQWGSGLSWDRRMTNLERFLGELVPYPVRESGSWNDFIPWLETLILKDGAEALWRTFHLGTAAVLLAGGVALIGSLFAARSLATRHPRGIHSGGNRGRSFVGGTLRAGSMFGRAMPEFILAFLLLQIFGPTVWALILSLAIHNGGILLRLGAEVIDNSPGHGSEMILAQGGSRSSAFLTSLLPDSFGRLVLFLFYRWETCIREATVLGMLGISSLGALISESRAGLFYDEVLLWVLLGAGLVFLGDLTSDLVRHQLRGGKTVSSH